MFTVSNSSYVSSFERDIVEFPIIFILINIRRAYCIHNASFVLCYTNATYTAQLPQQFRCHIVLRINSTYQDQKVRNQKKFLHFKILLSKITNKYTVDQ